MSKDQINIQRIPIKDLPEFAAAYIYAAKPGAFIPITLQRAESQAKNPIVDPNCIGLLVAFLGDEVVGYFGMLPMKLIFDGGSSTVWYFTGWNVSEKVRGRGVGRRLMREAIALDQDYILAASKFGRRASAQSGLIGLPTWKFVRINLNRIWHFNPFTWILRAFRKVAHLVGRKLNIDRLSNFFNSFFTLLFGWIGRPLMARILYLPYKRLFQKISLQRVEQVREEEPIKKEGLPPVRFYRGPEVVNWMLLMPWVLLPGQSRTENMEYYFADVRPGFEYLSYEVFLQGEYKGYIVLQFSDNGKDKRLKVLDVDLSDPAWILPIALKIGRQKRVDFLEMNYEYASDLHSTIMGRMLIEMRNRIYQYYAASADSPLIEYGEKIHFDLTDGDFAFT
jgi:GNAT superfamily N-acetyltransferase